MCKDHGKDESRHQLVARLREHKTIFEVRGNDVTLTGTVHSWSERASAKHAAWSTPCVRNVIDNMTLTY